MWFVQVCRKSYDWVCSSSTSIIWWDTEAKGSSTVFNLKINAGCSPPPLKIVLPPPSKKTGHLIILPLFQCMDYFLQFKTVGQFVCSSIHLFAGIQTNHFDSRAQTAKNEYLTYFLQKFRGPVQNLGCGTCVNTETLPFLRNPIRFDFVTF